MKALPEQPVCPPHRVQSGGQAELDGSPRARIRILIQWRGASTRHFCIGRRSWPTAYQIACSLFCACAACRRLKRLPAEIGNSALVNPGFRPLKSH